MGRRVDALEGMTCGCDHRLGLCLADPDGTAGARLKF